MRVYLEQNDGYVDVPSVGTGTALLRHLELCSEDVILTCNGKIIMPEARLREGDDIRILSVISGG